MKYAILDAHINYFQENGFIEFEDILTPNILGKTKKSLENILSSIYRRDLFRKFDIIKKIALNKTILYIIKTLTQKQNLRLTFDQLILKKEKTPFNELFSLNSHSSFQGIFAGIIINLDPNMFINNDLNKNNNLIFIKSSHPININDLTWNSEAFLLIAYGELKAIYKQNTKDPYNNYLKALGYHYGDFLKDFLHPTVY